MRQALKLHPDSRCDAVTGIEAEVVRLPSRKLDLRYFITGTIADLRLIPEIRPPERELWRSTCFEAFVRPTNDPWYYEFNFTPAKRWTLYTLAGYRANRSIISGHNVLPTSDHSVTHIESRGSDSHYEIFFRSPPLDPPRTTLHVRDKRNADLMCAPSGPAWRLGLSAVIEETNSRLSYWALAHPPGKPDFHHPDCFALELPPA